MQSGIVKAICQVGIFMICAQTIVHFRPKASYEKYLKMLVSSMVLIQLFLAVGNIFSAEGKAKLAERVVWFTASLETAMQQASDKTFFSEGDLLFEIMGEDPEPAEEKEKIQEITVQIEQISPITVNEIPGTTE